MRESVRGPFVPALQSPFYRGGVRTTLATLLAKYGTNAHAWLPGASGVSVSGLPTSNYLLSDGSTGYSTVDGVDGLTLDAMGALSAELTINGDFATDTNWTKAANWTISGGVATSDGSSGFLLASANPLTVGKTYLCSVTVSARTSGSVSYPYSGSGAIYAAAVGTFSWYHVATASALYVYSSSFAGSIDNISVREVTGTHLTQATTANKPLVRRGMLNELLNSATPATQSVTCIAAPYTLALYGTGNVVLSGTGAGTLTGTGASDLVVLNFTPTAGSVTFTKAGTVSSFGLFKGTWTAAQILAEGGIPTTTAAAASNPLAGSYSWSFDGSNDSLASATFAAGTLTSSMDCYIVVKRNTNAFAVLAKDVSQVTYWYFGAVGGTGAFSTASDDVAPFTHAVNGTVIPDTRDALTAALPVGSTGIYEIRGANLSTWQSFGISNYPDYPLAGDIYAVILTPAGSDADRTAIRRMLATTYGVTLA